MTIQVFILLLQGAIILALCRINWKLGKFIDVQKLIQLSNQLKEATDSLESALQKQKDKNK